MRQLELEAGLVYWPAEQECNSVMMELPIINAIIIKMYNHQSFAVLPAVSLPSVLFLPHQRPNFNLIVFILIGECFGSALSSLLFF